MEFCRELVVEGRYLHLPVKDGAPRRRMRLIVGGQTVRAFDIELPDADPDFWVFSDVSDWSGQRMTVAVEGQGLALDALDAISQGDAIRGGEDLYGEELRPQVHFSSRRGWNNDPNGLVYYDGEYHLFYQHNPYGRRWGNMHWGHAVSPDLVHWRELPVALYPDDLGTVFSGSAVVDRGNTGDFQSGPERALVCIYTSAGKPFAQSIAYSNDRGRTWAKYEGNPVLGHVAGHNRDPKVVWHEPTGRWVMALYLDAHRYALFASSDLKAWTQLCEVEVPGASECPDFFELAVDGDARNTRWVFWAANGTYLLGTFDGQTFAPQSEVLRLVWSEDSYAAQTWGGISAEDGRRIQIAWARVDLPDMPFNQFMNCPCELTLRTTADGVRLFSEPVREIEALRRNLRRWQNVALEPGENPLVEVEGELLDIDVELGIGQAAQVGLRVRGVEVRYDAEKGELACEGRRAPLTAIEGRVRLRLLVDRASIEIFGNDGQVALPVGTILDARDRSLAVFCSGGRAAIHSLEAHELCSAWRHSAAPRR